MGRSLSLVSTRNKLRHPNILFFYGVCVDPTLPLVVMEYCKYGNVLSYLRNRPIQTLNPNRIQLVNSSKAYDIARGIKYLHDQKIVHSDLKAVNILVNSKPQAVLADFGLSSLLQDIRTRSRTAGGNIQNVGTPYWTAPEIYNGKRMTEKSDIYSMGLTIWELFSGEPPYQVDLLVNFVLILNGRPERPSNLEEDDEIWKIIQKCWDSSPELRPSAKEVQANIGRLCSDSIEGNSG
ncbi:kinase-like protein [Mycena metata]|uniref:Kinase-like protein n=1 Tax=Mycena metata TaxID=1033252 RepID=A0AAD7HHX8_9AGAR|nr:kinase-like protein [Mycena metata]